MPGKTVVAIISCAVVLVSLFVLGWGIRGDGRKGHSRCQNQTASTYMLFKETQGSPFFFFSMLPCIAWYMLYINYIPEGKMSN